MKRTPLTAALIPALALTLSVSSVADAAKRSSSSSSRSSSSVSRSSTPRVSTPRPVTSPPARRTSGGSYGGSAPARPAATPLNKAPKRAVPTPLKATKSKVKVSDCDADDLVEGDIEDCGAAALPGAIATAAVSSGAAVATAGAVQGTDAARMAQGSSVIVRDERRFPWPWVLSGSAALLLLGGYVLTRR